MDSYLELIIGPMFSGKTSKLLDIYKQCKFCNMRVIIVNHEIDKRYHDTMVSSHDKVLAPCIQSAHLSDIKDDLIAKYDVILINEGQFFGELYSVVLELLQNKKKIYICGLDGDFSRKKFGYILDLIPMCDKITKLSSLCSKCNSKDQTMVGSDSYIPVCRKCYEA